jgi:chromosome partitioning protein
MAKQEENKIVVFANQKGGVGKTALCVLFANYLVSKNKQVTVIDADIQKSIQGIRNNDTRQYGNDAFTYYVQSFDVSKGRDAVAKLVDAAKNVSGYVLFDTPGNLSEDGMIPILEAADYIVTPYQYETSTISSTGIFLQTLRKLREADAQVHAVNVFVPNRIKKGSGTRDEWDFWSATDNLFGGFGHVTPIIRDGIAVQRYNTIQNNEAQSKIVNDAFTDLLKVIGK